MILMPIEKCPSTMGEDGKMGVRFEIPLESLEPLFNALYKLKPTEMTRLESKSIAVLRTMLHFELEKMMESHEERRVRASDFRKFFEEERKKQEAAINQEPERTY
jgi:hypothetical protein